MAVQERQPGHRGRRTERQRERGSGRAARRRARDGQRSAGRRPPSATSGRPAQLRGAPDNLGGRPERASPSDLVLRHEEVARRRTIRPTTTRLKMANAMMRERGVDGDGSDPAAGARQRLAAPPARPRGRRKRGAGHRPRLVAGQAGQREHDAGAATRQLTSTRPALFTASPFAHSSSIATPSTVSASSSGSVIGVACRYRTLG